MEVSVFMVPKRKRKQEAVPSEWDHQAGLDDAVVAFDPDFHLIAWNRAAEKVYGWKAEEVLGRLKREVFRPEYVGMDRSAVIGSLTETGEFCGTVIHRRKDDQPIYIESRMTTLNGPEGRKIGYVSVNRDVSARYEAKRIAKILQQISDKLMATLDPRRLLDELVVDVVDLVGAESGCAGLKSPQGMVCRNYFDGGTIKPLNFCWPPGQGLPGWVMIHRTTYMTNDASRDRQISRRFCLRLGIKTALSTPLLNPEGEAIGFFSIYNKKNPNGFSEADTKLAEAVSRIAGIAVQNGLIHDQLQKAKTIRGLLLNRMFSIQEEERRRLSRELHDEMGQSLTTLLIGLRTMEQAELPEAVLKGIGRLRTMTSNTLKKIQRISQGLHPRLLDHLGLEMGLLQVIDEYRAAGGIALDVHIDGLDGIRLGGDLELALYRIVQEGLTNIMKHAKAKAANVLLRCERSRIRLVVDDDGCGFDPETVLENTAGSRRHLGLHGIRERVNLLNGTVEIESAKGKGTTLSITIPLSKGAAR